MMPRRSATDLRELAINDVDKLVTEVDALRHYLTTGSETEQREVTNALRKLAYSHPDTAAELEPAMRKVASEYRATHSIRKNIQKAQEYLGTAKGVTDDSSLRHLAVTDVDKLPQRFDRIQIQLRSNDEDKQLEASAAARKLAYSYPDWAKELRSELRQLQREYPSGHQVSVNARKAESYIDDRATGTKQSVSTMSDTTGSSTGDTDVYSPSQTGDTEVYTDDTAKNTEIYTKGSTGDSETGTSPTYEMNFCPNCGVDLSVVDDSRYCPHCGSELSLDESTD